ncbi:MAG TPA: M24 family metallopeptidase [Solirubrobacteraceae bacterium]|jgi:Xaa-Pro aminopeptidase|nr:M24 family metallopeptidase [Solirubrobacteraceae bacterium]
MHSFDDDAAIGEQLERRRRMAVEAWNLPADVVVVVGAGEPVPVPGRGDRTYPYRAHSEYFYLTDRDDPGAALAFDSSTGWTEFTVPVGPKQRLYGPVPEERDLPAAGTRESVHELASWLRERTGKRVACLGCRVPEAPCDAEATSDARRALNTVRRPKDPVELHRMRRAEEATRAGFAAAAAAVAPDVTERAVQVELEAEFHRHGADDLLAFDTIVASGPNAAVLHFSPGERVLQPGELVLIDAGAEHRRYSSDVTRTYATSGEHTGAQAALYAAVDEARRAAIAHSRPGVAYRDVHREASLVVGAHLVDFGLLRGEPESLFEAGAIGLFFPHGIGHMVGLGIRDAVAEPHEQVPDHPGYPHMRIDLPLRPGYVLTIEPGVYFVEGILRDRDNRERHRRAVDWDRVDGLLDFGGIRLEDDVLVTEGDPEVLTADIPLVP